jgi:hypothetical protein
MAHVVHIKRLIWDGWDDEAVAAYTTAPVEYVRKMRAGEIAKYHPWPNGRFRSIDEASEPITPMVAGDL